MRCIETLVLTTYLLLTCVNDVIIVPFPRLLRHLPRQWDRPRPTHCQSTISHITARFRSTYTTVDGKIDE